MYKNVLQAIEGIGIFPLISMFIFQAVFLTAIIWFFKADKNHLHRMAHLPLESNQSPQQSDKEGAQQ